LRIGIARFVQKSNSFALESTGIEDFRENEFIEVEDVTRRYQNTRTFLGGAIESASRSGLSCAPILSVSAAPGGPVTDDATTELAGSFRRRLVSENGRIDGLVLELAGMSITLDGASVDGEIFRAVREACPDVPIVLGLHANGTASELMIRESLRVTAPKTVPDVEAFERGVHAIDVLRSNATNETTCSAAIERLPLLVPIASRRTAIPPLDQISASIHELSSAGRQDGVEVLWGNPYADTPDAGVTVVGYDDSGEWSANELARMIRDRIWENRSGFFVDGLNVEEAVHLAMEARETPAVIVDLGDNPGDGASGDGTTVLWALLDLGVRDAVLASIADEQAVSACVRAGVGANIEIPIGGRKDTRHGFPIDVRGKVTSIVEGPVQLSGPIGAGLTLNPGKIVLLSLEARHDGRVDLILTERPIEIIDLSLFEQVGIDISTREIVAIKSTIDYRPAFEPIASRILDVITPGITTPDPAFFAFQRIPRPIFPLDPV
jgi:microcystin degradation protein MlrC